MKRKFTVLLPTACLVAAMLLGGCKPEAPSADALAGQAAKVYYDQLLAGQVEAWVDGFYQPDSLPASYRSQLVDNARMFLATQREEHGGIDSVSLVRCTADTARHTANAFLLLTFGDRTHEEVVVPMVENGGVWMMR